METNNRYEAEGEDSDMGLPYVTSFLWCISLKVGTKLISIMHCGFATAVVLICSIMAHDASQYIGTEDDSEHVYTKTFYITLGIAVVSVVHVLLSFTLFYGVFWRKPLALRFWVLVMLALYAVAVLFIVVSVIVYGFNATGSDIFLSFLQGLLVFAFIGYCILCVYSYYLMLKSADDMDRPNKIDY